MWVTQYVRRAENWFDESEYGLRVVIILRLILSGYAGDGCKFVALNSPLKQIEICLLLTLTKVN